MTQVIYTKLLGGTGATKSSAQDGFWPDIAYWTLWPTVHCSEMDMILQRKKNLSAQHYLGDKLKQV